MLKGILSAITGGSAALVQSASTITLIIGAIYLADCRISSRGQEAIDRCYFTALPLMGVGIGVRGGFAAGYSTYNPALRRPDEEEAPSATPKPPRRPSR